MRSTTTTQAPAAEAGPEPARKLPAEVARVGNLTKDPELRFSKEKGTPWTSFGLAVERPKTPGDWSGERETTFLDVSCFGSLAENVAASLTKGLRAVVVGRPQVEEYTTDTGEKRTRKRIVATAVGAELRWAEIEVKRNPRDKATPTPTAYSDEEDF